jgi:hypothetical protein
LDQKSSTSNSKLIKLSTNKLVDEKNGDKNRNENANINNARTEFKFDFKIIPE